MPAANPLLGVFEGGQMTDLPPFSGTSFDGTELLEIVSPGTAANGVNYAITTLILATLLSGLRSGQIVIAQGQFSSPGSPYVVPTSMSRIYVNKATPEPTYIQFGAANLQLADVLIKDIAGTSDGVGNSIFCTVTADGLVNPSIAFPYGGFFFRPITSLNTWTLGTS